MTELTPKEVLENALAEVAALKAFIRQTRVGVLELSRLIPADADVPCHCGCKANEHNDGCIHDDCPGWDWPGRPYEEIP